MIAAKLPRRVGRGRVVSRVRDTATRSPGLNREPRRRIAAPGSAWSGLQRTRRPVDESTSPTFVRVGSCSCRKMLTTRRLPADETSRSVVGLVGMRILAVKRPRSLGLRTANLRWPASTVTGWPAGKPRPVTWTTVPATPAAGRSMTWLCAAAGESQMGTAAIAPALRPIRRSRLFRKVPALPATAGRMPSRSQLLMAATPEMTQPRSAARRREAM